jgi:nitroreductase
MDLVEALRTTGAVRSFTARAVADDVVFRVLDNARFAPSGGNRQGWRVIVVQDVATRAALRDAYLPGWYSYLAQREAGLVPWAPITDEVAERMAEARAREVAAAAQAGAGGFAEHLDEVPVLLVVLADLRALAAVDKGFDRYTFVGGASIYPFVWSILLAARAEGLAGVLTTMAVRREEELRAVLGVPREYALAGLLALGYPERQPTRLTRAAVPAFTTLDRLDGPPLKG